MNKKISMMLAALAVMTCTVTAIPANAATRLDTNEGCFNSAVALNKGLIAFNGYVTIDDDMSLYVSDSKNYKEIEESVDYDYSSMAKYGKNYIKGIYSDSIWSKNKDTYLIDLVNEKVNEDESLEDKKDIISMILKTSLKKTDRYGKVESIQINEINNPSFGDNSWYLYTATPAEDAMDKDEANIKVNYGDKTIENCLYGFVNEKGKYVDASYLELSNDMKITEVVGILGQDKNNIYIMIHGDKDDAYYIEKVSKETGDKRDGAFLPNVVEVYKISNEGTDAQKEAYEIINNSDAEYDQGIYGQFTVKKDNLYLTQLSKNSELVRVTNLKLTTTDPEEVGTVELVNTSEVDIYARKNKQNYSDIEYSGKDEKVKVNLIKDDRVSTDVDGTIWALGKGIIYKYDGKSFKEQFRLDRSIDCLDVYDSKNLVAWEKDGEVYAAYQNGKVTSEGIEKVD